MRRTGNLSSIRDALERTLSHLDMKARVRESILPHLWVDLVGPVIGRVSRVRIVRGETLYLDAETPSWATTLSMQSQELIQRINSHFGEKVISEIHVSGKGFEPSPSRQRRRREPTPSEAELEAVALSPGQMASLQEQWRDIPNLHLRSVLTLASLRRAKLDAWRLEHGWKRCAQCDSVFRGRGKVCRLCRPSNLGRTSPREKRSWKHL